MKYKIHKITTASGGVIHKAPSAGELSFYDVQVEVKSPGRNMFRSLEDFEVYLTNIPTWCTSEMVLEALRDKYPEKFL